MEERAKHKKEKEVAAAEKKAIAVEKARVEKEKADKLKQLADALTAKKAGFVKCVDAGTDDTKNKCDCKAKGTIAYGNQTQFDEGKFNMVENIPEGGLNCKNETFGFKGPDTDKMCWCRNPVEKCSCLPTLPADKSFCAGSNTVGKCWEAKDKCEWSVKDTAFK